MKFWHKFVRLRQVNTPCSWDKFQNCCTDIYLIRFLPNSRYFVCFCEFRRILRIYLNFVQKLTDTIMTSPEHEARKTVQRGQQRFDCWPELHLWVFIAIKRGNRPTWLLPHAKMLLVPISFILCLVDYVLRISLNKCNISCLLNHTERSWHTYRFTVVFVSGHRICLLMQEDFLWPLLKYNLAFRCGWTRVLFFSKVHSGSELLNNFLWSVNVLFFSNYCIMLGPAC